MSDERKAGTKRGLLALPVIAAIASVALYSSQATQLFYLGLTNYDAGLPLAGLAFIWVFIALRRHEFVSLLKVRKWSATSAAAGATLVVIPYLPVLLGYPLAYTYAYSGVAIATCWVGVMVLLEPKTFRFVLPYLGAYGAAVGTATYLDSVAGDPLANVVAGISKAMTSLTGLQVQWSSVFFTFNAAGGKAVTFFISQECSGTVSVSLFLLLLGLMYLDSGGQPRTTIALAVGGTFLFIFLNALRVYTMIVGGIFVSLGLLDSLHQWVGYVYYAIGYSVIILLYTRQRRKGESTWTGHPVREDALAGAPKHP